MCSLDLPLLQTHAFKPCPIFISSIKGTQTIQGIFEDDLVKLPHSMMKNPQWEILVQGYIIGSYQSLDQSSRYLNSRQVLFSSCGPLGERANSVGFKNEHPFHSSFLVLLVKADTSTSHVLGPPSQPLGTTNQNNKTIKCPNSGLLNLRSVDRFQEVLYLIKS